MKWTWMLIALLIASAVAMSAQGHIVREMTPERIREAIALGMKAKELPPYKLQEKARFSWPPRIADYTTPFMRVALAANTAKKQYKVWTETDVTPELVAPEIEVYAWSRPLAGAAIANVEAILILPRDSKDASLAIRPTRMTEATEQYKNLFGFNGEGRGMVAVFPLEVWREDNDVHVIFDKGIPDSHGTGNACTDCKSRIYLDNIQ